MMNITINKLHDVDLGKLFKFELEDRAFFEKWFRAVGTITIIFRYLNNEI